MEQEFDMPLATLSFFCSVASSSHGFVCICAVERGLLERIEHGRREREKGNPSGGDEMMKPHKRAFQEVLSLLSTSSSAPHVLVHRLPRPPS
jgi:hypothetical protein